MVFSYVIIDDDEQSTAQLQMLCQNLVMLEYLGSATNYAQGLQLIVEKAPQVVFLEIAPQNPTSQLSLAILNDLHQFMAVVPYLIITTKSTQFAFDAIQYQVFDYVLKPLRPNDVNKVLLKLQKKYQQQELTSTTVVATAKPMPVAEQPLVLCIKNYGDYRYINTADICYLHADNNSTDIILNNGEVLTAFKTLKHFEAILEFPFLRIHNSYMVNRHYIARIQMGKRVCFVKNSMARLPFSKSYKSNIDLLISNFYKGNCLEI